MFGDWLITFIPWRHCTTTNHDHHALPAGPGLTMGKYSGNCPSKHQLVLPAERLCRGKRAVDSTRIGFAILKWSLG